MRQGPEAGQELQELGAQAAEVDGTLFLPIGANKELVAHALQRHQRGSGADGGAGGNSDLAERDARLAASAARDGRPAQVGQRAASHVQHTPEGEDTTADNDRVAVTDTLLYMSEQQGLIVIRAPASGEPHEIAQAFDDAGATTCADWQQVQVGDPTYPLFYALLQAREVGPSAIDYESLAPVVTRIVGQDPLAAGMMPGPWQPPRGPADLLLHRKLGPRGHCTGLRCRAHR